MNVEQNTYNPPITNTAQAEPGMGHTRIYPSMRVYQGMMRNTFPKWITQYGIVVYVMALVLVSAIYSSYSLPWYYVLSGVVAVFTFFVFSSTLVERTLVNKIRGDIRFERRLFLVAFIPRMIWMILAYAIFMQNYGDAFGFENGDAVFYDDLGQSFSKAIQSGTFKAEWEGNKNVIDISDMGYATYVGFIYTLTGNSIIALRLLKCIWSSLTVILLYRLAKRNFGRETARYAAICCAMWPNFWYYCGTHLKEVEMVFLSVLFVEQAEQMLRSRRFTAWKLLPILLIVSAMFTIRSPLAIVALLSLVFAVAISFSKVVTWAKRIIVGVIAILLIAFTMGNRIEEQSRKMIEAVQSGQQQANVEWRTRRAHGNAFAKYAGATVFAPMIFTLPFPTMVESFKGQEVQQFLNGGNYVKNILSFFTILALISLLITGKWRDHLLPLSFMIGYLIVLTMSVFAQSERFHQPAMPFELMFAAYGISVALTKKKYKRWFGYWSIVMFIAAIAWNWFKLAGRGLV